MPIDKKFLKYIYSSAPLEGKAFNSLENGEGIFKRKFYETDLRKPILDKLKSSFEVSEGGVFLISGYRGIGKTTFLNYVINQLAPEEKSKEKFLKGKSKRFIKGAMNLSSIDERSFKFELISKMVMRLKIKFEEIQLDKSDDTLAKKLYEVTDSLYKEIFSEEKVVSEKKGGGKFGIFNQTIELSGGDAIERRKKDNIYSWEQKLKEVLNKASKINIRLIFVLDELDKMSFFSYMNEDKNKSEKSRQMERLLQVLSEIKSLLFECGAIFVLIVNKDIYDYWKYHHNYDDLFMNLVTHVEYMPSYTKKEMELNSEFTISLAPDVDVPFPLSPSAIKKYFQTCAYYESYGNPRLFFQILSQKIKNEEIVIGREEAQYLKNKVRLFELNELIYKYVHEDIEFGFDRLLLAVNELKQTCRPIIDSKEKNQLSTGTELFPILFAYYEHLKAKGSDLTEFWGEEFLYAQFETLLIMIKEQDHFFHTNYIIHRLTDFLRIIEERHFISVEAVIEEMRFQKFEYKDAIGRYLINLLIPLNIILLRNNKVINIEGKNIHYTYGFNSNKYYYHRACEAELDGDFKKAFDNYEHFFKTKSFFMEAYNQKLRFFYYMLKLGFYDKKINIELYWYNTLLEMKPGFSEKFSSSSGNLKMASFMFRKKFFLNRILNNDRKKYYKENYKSQLTNQDNVEDIEDMFDRAIEKDSSDTDVKRLKGYFLFWEKKYAAALGMFLESSELYKEPLSMIRIGDIYVKQEKYSKACEFYKEAICISSSWLHKALLIMSVAELICEDKFIDICESQYEFMAENDEFIVLIRKELEIMTVSKNTEKCLLLLFALNKICLFLRDTKNKIELDRKIKNISQQQKEYIMNFKKILPSYVLF